MMISICCITYNHEKYISKALDSFLMQKTNYEFDILIYDDASTDNTPSIIRSYTEKYSNQIKPIYQSDNQYSKGINVDYIYNFLRATGKYIALCEGDDYWTDPLKLQKQVDFLEKNPDFSMCFHAAKIVNSLNQIVGKIKPYHNSGPVNLDEIIVKGGGLCPTQSIVYLRKSLLNLPDFYFNSPVGDYPLQIFSTYFGKAYYFNSFMSVYRKVLSHGTSFSSLNNNAELLNKVNLKIIHFLKNFNVYTNFLYSNSINKNIEERIFYLNVYKKNISQLFTKNHLFIFFNLTFKKKIMIILFLLCTNIYKKLQLKKYS